MNEFLSSLTLCLPNELLSWKWAGLKTFWEQHKGSQETYSPDPSGLVLVFHTSGKVELSKAPFNISQFLIEVQQCPI